MKRFYTDVTTTPADAPDSFAVLLDGRSVRTPQKHFLVLPTLALADGIASEWSAQSNETVDVHTMPLTRHACTAIDRIAGQRHMTVAEIANFARSDLLCYRAKSPEILLKRQSEGWQPVLDWLAETLNAPLEITTGIEHVEQPVASIDNIKEYLRGQSDMQLSAQHTLTAGMGSVVLGLAVAHEHLTADQAYELSIIDEMFQTEHWGDDQEWVERRAALKMMIVAAETMLKLLKDKT